MRGFVLLCAGLLGLAACASPEVVGVVPPIAIPGTRPSPVPLPATLRLPPGPGPYPVVIILHGCGGLGVQQRDWSSRLLGWGYGTVVLDSLRPRSIASVCAPDKQPLVTRNDRAADVVATIRWLARQPGVDATRIAVLGESHGGGTAATVILHPYADMVAGSLKASIDYYGPCRQPDAYAGIPFLALAGDADTWANPADTCRKFQAALPQGAPMQLAIYPGAVHGFDNPRLVNRIYNTGHPMQSDPQAASDSFARIKAFLATNLGQ